MGHVVRTLAAEHAAEAFIRVNDAQQHPQGGRLARTIGAEDAVDRTFRHGEVDAVHRRESVETLHQPARLDGERDCAGKGRVARRLPLA